VELGRKRNRGCPEKLELEEVVVVKDACSVCGKVEQEKLQAFGCKEK